MTMIYPKLQLALDLTTLPAALKPLQQASTSIDIIEVGTVLCLAEGLHAVRAIRALYPDKTVLADIRITEAGSILAKMCFDAGADWVSVASGAALSTHDVVLAEAKARGGDMQVELNEGWSWEQAERWRGLGVKQVIIKRSRDAEAKGEISWRAKDMQRIHKLHDLGYHVTVTGGITPQDIALFSGVPVDVFIAGRAIYGAADPAAAAKAFQSAIAEVYSA